MNTATTLIASATLTAAAEVAAGAVQVDLNALDINSLILEATLTNGVVSPGAGRYLEIYFAFGTANTSADIPATYSPSMQQMHLLLPTDASAVRVYTSGVIVKKARYIYIWYSHELMNSTVGLVLKAVS